MNALALALPSPLTADSQQAPAPAAPAAGIRLRADTCVAQTGQLIREACRRGQFEDASAAARVALPLAVSQSPHQALLQVLADAQPALMVAPEERRLYLLRAVDGTSQGVIRLRDNGGVGLQPSAGYEHWSLIDGNLELRDGQGRPTARFPLCGERAGQRLYLGESLADGQPYLLQEVRCTYARLSLLDPELVDNFCGLYEVDAMVPAELPAGAALLLAAPHCGADRLAATLNQREGLFFDGELLHPQAIGLADGLLSPAAGTTLHAMRAKDAPWFARMMLGRSFDTQGRDLSAASVRGFTLAPTHSQSALDWAIAEPALRIVHVVRSNLLAEFADILASQGGNGAAPLHFEPERFGRFVEMKQRYLEGIRRRLIQRNGDTVEVDGSRLNPNTIAELTGFLTDQPATAAATVAAPASGHRVIERFTHPEAVLPCLRVLGRLGWAEVEGMVPDLV